MIHLDTHVMVWLFAGQVERFPPRARHRMDAGSLVISPMVELELQYLYEIGRTTRPGREVVADLAARVGLVHSQATFADIVERAAGLPWTRDPFDRIIVASALTEGCALLTRDAHILANFPGAVWDS